MKIKSKSLQTWAKLLPFLAPYRKYMVLIVAAMLFSAAIDTVQPLFSGYAVDHFIEPGTTEGIVPFVLLYILCVVLMTLSTILMAILRRAWGLRCSRPRHEGSLFVNLQRLSLYYYNVTSAGHMLSRVMSDTE